MAVVGPDPAVLGRPDPVHGPDVRLGKVAGVPITKLKSDHLGICCHESQIRCYAMKDESLDLEQGLKEERFLTWDPSPSR